MYMEWLKKMDISELLPIVQRLSVRYTSGESSSFSYETAAMLMDAAVYSINENFMDDGSGMESFESDRTDGNSYHTDSFTGEGPGDEGVNNDNSGGQQRQLSAGTKAPDWNRLYRQGCEKIVQKVGQAKEIYEGLMEDLEVYGCRNYSDTIYRGMPEFFLHYDPVFEPQNTILTLDYPCLWEKNGLAGVDRIVCYLQGIVRENRLLKCFDRSAVMNLLEHICPDYRELYLDNICQAVLVQAAGCIIADCSLEELALEEKDYRMILLYFEGDSPQKRAEKTGKILEKLLISAGLEEEDREYFLAAQNEIAVRLSQLAGCCF